MTAPAHRRAAVLGSPVGHSLSPALHAAAYRSLGLDWTYEAISCDAAELAALLDRVRADPAWVGLSLTMPLKTAAVELADSLDPLAADLGAVNTLVVAGGRLHGANTDVDGMVAALAETGWVSGAPPVLLGAGGTARAALAALARLAVPSAVVVARRPAVAAALVTLGERLGVAVTVAAWTAGWALPIGADLVISTAPVGATDALAVRGWPAGVRLVESLYEPWPTALAAAALAAGAPVAGGLAVLAGQAVGQVRLFTGRTVELSVLRAAGEAALAARAAAPAGPGAGDGPTVATGSAAAAGSSAAPGVAGSVGRGAG